MVTVQDILAIPELDLRLLAGAPSTGRQVRWVHAVEVPRTIENLRGGELLLTAGEGFRGGSGQRLEQLDALAARQIAALGFGLGEEFDQVPPELIECAEELGVPLLAIPRHVPLSAIIESVSAKLVNEQYALLQRSIAVHEKLLTVVLQEQGLGAVLSSMTALTGCSAVLFDFYGVVLAQAAGRRPLGAQSLNDLWKIVRARRGGRGSFMVDVDGAGVEAQVFPVVAAQRIAAFLAVIKDARAFGEYERIVFTTTVTALALELVRRKAVAETERRLVGDFIDQLAASALAEDEIVHRLSFFGLDASAAHFVIIAELDLPEAEGRRPERQAGVPSPLERLHAATDEFLAGRRRSFVSVARPPSVVTIMDADDDDEAAAREVAEALRREAGDALTPLPVSIGYGRAYERATDLRRSLFEAGYALRLSRLGGAQGIVAGFRELGSYGLLLGLQDTPSLRAFTDSVLGELVEHDEQKESDLLASLTCFLEANGHWGDAAARLYVHRHTLRYRMRRVEEITGRKLDDANDRMDLWFALKARGLLESATALESKRLPTTRQ